MHTFTQTIEVAAPLEEAWRLLSAVHAWPDWLPTVSRVEPMDGVEMALGHRYRVLQPKLRPAVWRIAAVEAPYSFTWESRALGMVSLADHRLEVLAPGRLRLTLSIAMRGLLLPLVRRAYGALIDDYMAQEAASFKRRLEVGG